MFDGIKNFLRRIARMFGYTQLKSILGTDVALSQGMIDAINEWKLMLDGAADWNSSDVQTLKIEQGI